MAEHGEADIAQTKRQLMMMMMMMVMMTIVVVMTLMYCCYDWYVVCLAKEAAQKTITFLPYGPLLLRGEVTCWAFTATKAPHVKLKGYHLGSNLDEKNRV